MATVGLASGTDDTTRIQGLLTAARTAGGGLVKGSPGQAYQISAPLIIGSSTTLDMTGCTVTLKAGSNCNMVNNFTVTAQRTVADGAITAASTTLTSATAAFTSADIGRSVYITGASASAAQLTATIATLISATQVTLDTAAGTTVTAAAVSIFNRDAKILITGGTWNRGTNHGTGTGTHSFRMRHLDGFTVRGIFAKSTRGQVSGKYFINPGDCTEVLVEDCVADLQSTIVQPNGPIKHMTVRDIRGNCGDDLVAFCANDWPQSGDTNGDMVDIVVENLSPTSCLTTLKFLGGPDGACRRVTGTGIYGTTSTTSQGVVWIGDDTGAPQTVGGVIEGVTLRNVKPTQPVNVPAVFINGTNVRDVMIDRLWHNNPAATTSPVSITGGGTIGSIVVRNVNAPNLGALSLVNVAGTGTIVTRLVLDGAVVASTTACKVVNVSATVTTLIADKVTLNSATTAGFGIYVPVGGTIGTLITTACGLDASVAGVNFVRVLGSVGTLQVVGCRVNATASAYFLALDAATAAASVTRTVFTGCSQVGGGGFITAPTSGHTLPSVDISACDLDGTAWVADLATTTELHMTSLSHRNPVNMTLNLRATALITVRADSLTGMTVTLAAGGTLRSRSFGVCIDVSKLTKSPGDVAQNINGALACGVGPVASDGTVWKNLFSGATY